MSARRVFALLLMASLLGPLLAPPAFAVQPDEVLADPVLEARARALSAELRCVVCRNESIDESNAEIARDMRLVLRERLVAGDSDAAAMGYLVERFGEYVLLNPPRTGTNLILWASAPLLFLFGLAIAATALRRGRAREAEAEPSARPLSPEEEARLRELMQGALGDRNP